MYYIWLLNFIYVSSKAFYAEYVLYYGLLYFSNLGQLHNILEFVSFIYNVPEF